MANDTPQPNEKVTPAPEPAPAPEQAAGRGYHTEMWKGTVPFMVCDGCPFDSRDEATMQAHVAAHTI